MSQVTSHKSQKLSLAVFVLAIASALTASNVIASVTYNYTGNPFDHSNTPPGLIGDWLIGSVTFSDPAITSSFTGDAYASSISQWSIQVAQLPNTAMDNTNSVTNSQWPLWFHFDNGALTGWQLLAQAATNQLPEIYTTHNSPYVSIQPTADDYFNGTQDVYNLNSPGSWAVVPLPAAIWLFGSALAVIGVFSRRK